MRGGNLKLVNTQKLNAPCPMLSMPSWRRMGHLRERAKAESLILLSEVGMLIFVIEFEDPRNYSSPISTTPSLSSTSAKLLRSANAPTGIDVTEGSTTTRTSHQDLFLRRPTPCDLQNNCLCTFFWQKCSRQILHRENFVAK